MSPMESTAGRVIHVRISTRTGCSTLDGSRTLVRFARARFAARPLAIIATSALAVISTPLAAQQFPGLVIVQPTAPPQPQPQQQPTTQSQTTAPTKPKPRPKHAATKSHDAGSAPSSARSGERIFLLVNDEAVTAREVEQRARFLGASTNVAPKAQEIFKRLASSEATNAKFRSQAEEIIKQNQGKSRDQIIAMIEKMKAEMGASLQRQALEQARGADAPKYRDAAIEEIIEEKLKLQEAKKEGVEVSEEEVNRIIKSMAERSKQTEAQFAAGLKSSGIDINTMKARFKAAFAWREVIRRKYGMYVQVNEKEVERMIAAQASTSKTPTDTQELQLQKIVFALPDKLNQGAFARALADADAMRRKFSGCRSMESLAKEQASAKLLPAAYIKPSAIGEPVRSMLLSAKDGEMLPPQPVGEGVELIAICARRALQIDDKQRMDATQELQSKKFEEYAVRRLRELRQDAQIERRG